VREFSKALTGKVNADFSNPFNSDLTPLVTPDLSSAAQEIAKVTPGGACRRGVQHRLRQRAAAHTSEGPRPPDVFITGDDAEAQGARVIVRREALAALARRRRPGGRSLARGSEHAADARDARKGYRQQKLPHRPQRSRPAADSDPLRL
jgi:hypothetical protein